MEDCKEWTFWKLLDEYMSTDYFFGTGCLWDELPWSIQIELSRLVAVLNAFTGGHYDVTTDEGKGEVIDAFENGFNMRDKPCTNKQLEKLKQLFPEIDDLFDELEDERPLIRDFYRYLFAVYHASFNYVTIYNNLLNHKYTDEFWVVNSFKDQNMDAHIVKKVGTIRRAFKILLGDTCNKKFTKSELIEKFGYPDIKPEKLADFNKKWCRFNGIRPIDFRKIRSYFN